MAHTLGSPEGRKLMDRAVTHRINIMVAKKLAEMIRDVGEECEGFSIRARDVPGSFAEKGGTEYTVAVGDARATTRVRHGGGA